MDAELVKAICVCVTIIGVAWAAAWFFRIFR